jgi:clan AA aspartic protease
MGPGMGLVMTKVKLVNLSDTLMAEKGMIPPEAIRSVEIDALADTGAIGLAIPEEVAEAIGAPMTRRSPVRIADGRVIDVTHIGPLRIEVLGRSMSGDAMVLPRGTTPLLGAVQMEMLDLIVSPSTGEVIPRDPKGPVLPLLRAS